MDSFDQDQSAENEPTDLDLIEPFHAERRPTEFPETKKSTPVSLRSSPYRPTWAKHFRYS